MSFKLIFLFLFCGVAQSKLINLSCNQIRAFVDGHNFRRLQLAKEEVPGQPAASDMKLMVWDSELATKAAKWASRKQFSHNPDRNIGSGRFKTGENIYWYSTTDSKHKIDIDSSLKSWFDEYQHYTYGPLSMSDFDGSSQYQIGHYTQMAWADTTHLGCAISQYWQGNTKEFLIVCNYGPSGNYIGDTPYKIGRNASNFLKCGTDDCSRPYGDKC
ncbi:unnamed protein product [Parnassius apollo]|uniref:(apollo) hypothetical protein n=1 Tax=Parnassius apollo TaxID=110799 RepID=A0A8S3X0Q0_PARAO|nr:unnamed protein product [Parnassius apollo]